MMTLALLPILLAAGPPQGALPPADALALMAQQIVGLLQVVPGESAAYLGTGGRLFAVPLAAATGTGTVYVVDVDGEALADVQRLATDSGLTNIRTRNVSAGGPPLGQAVQVLALFDTWHHLETTPQYFRALTAMLSVGGRLAIIDLSTPYRVATDPGMTAATSAAGFARVERHRIGDADLLVFFK